MNSISVAAAQINGVFKSVEDACKRENIDINYAFVIQLRDILRYEQQNIQEKLPSLLKKVNSRVKIPSKISDLIRKIENKFDKANTEELKEKVLREVLLLSEDSTVIGIHCSKFRIFSNNLYNFVCGQVTNGVVYELEKFRSSNNYTFTELTKWVHHIVGLKSETFSEHAMRYSVKSLLKNRLDMSRKGYSFSEQFLNETYTYPKMGTNKASSTDNLAEGCENPKCSKQKLKTIKCCQQIQNLNYQLQHEKEEVEEELTQEYKENQQLSDQLNKIIKDKTISDKELSDLKQKYETVINKLQKYNTRNINKKIQRRDTKLETINKTLTNEKEKSSFMEESITQSEKEILVLKEDKRNLQKRISYLKSKPELFENKQNENISKLRDENKELQESNAILQEIIEECTKIPIFKTRKDGSREFCDEMKKNIYGINIIRCKL
ncbi:Hypothetical predicted protein [Mytilus galloprovincialis]|uniref:Uncharacterized protein n=1 Tax=Mytilus galloprovincialis TaxID=29158 RepID=A0A8B6G506_MYTGA|nr:Hypothetical predicted protein [Mytilus galloprovincialis]